LKNRLLDAILGLFHSDKDVCHVCEVPNFSNSCVTPEKKSIDCHRRLAKRFHSTLLSHNTISPSPQYHHEIQHCFFAMPADTATGQYGGGLSRVIPIVVGGEDSCWIHIVIDDIIDHPALYQ
jgi:hypothetical protein